MEPGDLFDSLGPSPGLLPGVFLVLMALLFGTFWDIFSLFLRL